MSQIRTRDRDHIIQALRAGVVPQNGLQHIQVGRDQEVKALLGDIEKIADAGSAFRLIIGDYGSGKTFFLSLVRTIAHAKKMVTAHADLNPDRRIHSTSGHARSLYSELMKNIATRSKPDGGALPSIVESFISSAAQEAGSGKVEEVIKKRLQSLSELVGGYDFADVIAAYWRGHEAGDESLKMNALRWLRGEFSTKTDARNALGVRNIVEDDTIYDFLKLIARFVKLAGYSGFLVCLDELVNLYKMANSRARNSNYEQILRILNDSLQGGSVGMGVLLGGTPDFLLDTRKGLYSYQALQSRLAENRFQKPGLVDFSGPVIKLSSLAPEDLFILLQKLRHVSAAGISADYAVNDDEIKKFMAHCSQKIGDAYFKTPRETVVSFLSLLSLLEQNNGLLFKDILSDVGLSLDNGPDMTPIDPSDDEGDNELKSFKL